MPCLAYPDAAEVDAELQAAAARAKRQPLLGAGPQHAPSPTFPSLDDIYTLKLSRSARATGGEGEGRRAATCARAAAIFYSPRFLE